MSEQHGSYYIPEYSVLPIIGAIALLFFAVGSLNLDSGWGPIVCGIGLLLLAVMLFSWFWSVIHESRQGLYDAQMDRSFRWGMFWFVFAEACLFGTLLGALLYVRWITLPWLAGHGMGGSLLTNYVLWPDFQAAWPLVKNPAPYLFAGLKSAPVAWNIPFLNTVLLLVSAILAVLALKASKKANLWIPAAGLLLAILLGILFLVFQIYYYIHITTHYGLAISHGVYGSLFFMLTGFHSIHVLIGIIILAVTLVRHSAGHFTADNHFGFEAAIWFWSFVTLVWVVIFVLLYGF